MAYMDQNIIDQLVRAANGGLVEGGPFGLDNNHLPYSRRMLQEPPQYFQSPAANAAYNMFAPMVASHLAGGSSPPMLPQLGRGVSAYDAFYGRDVTAELYEIGRKMVMQDIGSGFGLTAARAANRMGMRPGGVSEANWMQGASRMGATAGGQALAQAAMSSRMMQGLMGGNPMDIYNSIFPQMQKFATPSEFLVDPMNMEDQSGMADVAATFGNALTRRIYDDPKTGQQGIIPNTQFTRGYSTSDIGKLTAYMAERNFEYLEPNAKTGNLEVVGMRGTATNDAAKVKMVGDQLALLESVGEVLHDTKIGAQIEALERFTQGMSNKINPEVLQEAMDNISATADVLQISSEKMMEGILSVQKAMGGIGGGTVTATGRVLGGMASGNVAQYVETQARTIAMMTGRNYTDVIGEQLSLSEIGAKSPQGRSIRAIEYLRQRGAITDELYQPYLEALQSGDKEAQTKAEERIYKASYFGSRDRAYDMLANDALMQQIEDRTDDIPARRAVALIQQNQERENPERTGQTLRARREALASDMLHSVGIGMPDAGVLGNAQLDAMTGMLYGVAPRELEENLRLAGRTEEADRLVRKREEAARLANVLRERYEAAGGGERGMEAVRASMGSAQFDEFRGGLNAAASEARTEAMITELRGPKAETAAILRAQLGELERTSWAGSPDGKAATESISKALASGQIDLAEAMMGRHLGTVSKADQALIFKAGEDAQKLYRGQLGNLDRLGNDEDDMAAAETDSVWLGKGGLRVALEQREFYDQAVQDAMIIAGGNAGLKREMRERWASRKTTIGQRLVLWGIGSGSVYDVLGVQEPEGGMSETLKSMDPETVAKLSDRAISKLDLSDDEKSMLTKTRDYLKTDEGARALKESRAIAALSKNDKASKAQRRFEAELMSLSDEEFERRFNTGEGNYEDFKRAREYLLQNREALGYGDGGREVKMERTEEKTKRDRSAKDSDVTKISGRVTLIREDGSVVGTMDLDGAELSR